MTANRFKCLACGAAYFDLQADGSAYHHACGPLPRDKNGVEPERKNKRDERIVQDRYGEFAGIVSEGAGVECLNNPRISEPVWLTQRKLQAAKKWENEDV